MTNNNFTEEDKEKLIKFLNAVADKADFKMNTMEVIEYFKLLTFMQKILIPKIDKHILEVKKVVQAKDEDL